MSNSNIPCINAAEMFKNDKISIKRKVFLYNSKLWSFTKEIIHKIDKFQRKIISGYIPESDLGLLHHPRLSAL